MTGDTLLLIANDFPNRQHPHLPRHNSNETLTVSATVSPATVSGNSSARKLIDHSYPLSFGLGHL
jgi:hypothetical protein